MPARRALRHADPAPAARYLGAGRTGVEDPFRLLLPMTFRDYLGATSAPIPLPERVTPDALRSDAARRAVASLEPFVDELDLAWQRFLECGGFPRAVGEAHHHGAVSNAFLFDLTAWLIGDVDAEAPLESVVRMLDELHRRTGAPINLRATAEALNLSRARLDARLNRLIWTFGAFWCAQLGADGLQAPGSQSKLYLIDPLLARLPRLRDPSFPEADMTRQTEGQLAMELARSVDRLAPDRLIEQRAVLYARTSTGKEIDFAPVPVTVSEEQQYTSPLEAKWVSRGWRREALVLRGRYGAGVLATKDIVDLSGDVWAVPAPILALLLN
jgi:hypothetical protein